MCDSRTSVAPSRPWNRSSSAWQAAATSFVLFILGAIIPVLPFVFASGATAVLASPKLTETEVENFARMQNVSDEVLRIIGTSRNWTKSYTVVAALVKYWLGL